MGITRRTWATVEMEWVGRDNNKTMDYLANMLEAMKRDYSEEGEITPRVIMCGDEGIQSLDAKFSSAQDKQELEPSFFAELNDLLLKKNPRYLILTARIELKDDNNEVANCLCVIGHYPTGEREGVLCEFHRIEQAVLWREPFTGPIPKDFPAIKIGPWAGYTVN